MSVVRGGRGMLVCMFVYIRIYIQACMMYVYAFVCMHIHTHSACTDESLSRVYRQVPVRMYRRDPYRSEANLFQEPRCSLQPDDGTCVRRKHHPVRSSRWGHEEVWWRAAFRWSSGREPGFEETGWWPNNGLINLPLIKKNTLGLHFWMFWFWSIVFLIAAIEN